MLSQMEGRQVDFNALTQLLRRGLAMADTLKTSLQDELAFVDYYATIEGQQIGDDFRYSKEIDEGIDIRQVSLPAMTIQIFVENAIKHGLRPMKPENEEMRQLTIHVSRQGQATLVEVTDNGQGLKNGPTSQAQTGMKVVRQTIQMLNERNQEKIDFGVNNLTEEGKRGCRSWILLPDHFDYHVGK
jgi:LytS/YehU family sensor histidine kinase